jgi:hypothetical protein
MLAILGSRLPLLQYPEGLVEYGNELAIVNPHTDHLPMDYLLAHSVYGNLNFDS